MKGLSEMRNTDKIRELEKELGRYRKKVADQNKAIGDLEKRLEGAAAANIEVHKAIDAILAQAAVRYGERVRDDETGEEVGWRMVVPVFSVDDTLGQYEVRTRKDEAAGEYIVGVMERRETSKQG